MACSGVFAQTQPAPPTIPVPGEPEEHQETPPDQIASDEAGSMEVAAHLWTLMARYRFVASADRVRVTLIQPDGSSQMHSLEVRCVPGLTGLVRVELGDIAVQARAGRFQAIHLRDPTRYVQQTSADPDSTPGEILRRFLPPLPIPHISLAFDSAAVEWNPLLSGLVWDGAERIGAQGAQGVRLVGRTDMGVASLELVGARLQRFEADLDPEGRTRIIVDCEPLEASDPDNWAFRIDGRRQVGSLSSLGALPTRIVPGSILPRLEATRVDSGTTAALEWDPYSLAASNHLEMLVVFRNDATPEFVGLVSEIVDRAAASVGRELTLGRIQGRYAKHVRLGDPRAIVEVVTDGDTLARVADQGRAWAAPGGSPGQATTLAWTGADSRLVDRLVLGEDAALAVHDRTGRVLGVMPIDTLTHPDAVLALVVDATGAPASP